MRSFAILFFVFLAGCNGTHIVGPETVSPPIVVSTARQCEISDELLSYTRLDAQQEVNKAMLSNDFRLLWLTMDFGLPNIELETFSCLLEHGGINHKPVISDIVNCEEQSKFQQQTFEFMVQYNALIQQAVNIGEQFSCST